LPVNLGKNKDQFLVFQVIADDHWGFFTLTA